MATVLRLPELALGELEREVLEILWAAGPCSPTAVHERLANREISVNTVASALKRLVAKDLLTRDKVSHAYVYHARVSRAQLQRDLIQAIASQFGATGDAGFLAAFVDLAEAHGEETLRELEQLIAARLGGTEGEA